MEYTIARAMELNRINETDIGRLQAFEELKGRCLMPHEIQDSFGLLTIKEQYEIPENDPAQSGHNQRLRAELKRLNIAPMTGDISPLDVGSIHAFDVKVKKAIEDGYLDVSFMGNTRKKRLSDQMEAL